MGQGNNFPYCNITTDLQFAYKNIENFNGLDEIQDFALTSGQTNTYQKAFTGYYDSVYDDEVALVEKTSIATVEGTAGTFWYDSTNDILYIHTYNSDDPENSVIEAMTENWNDFKTSKRNDAMEMVEAKLRGFFNTPLPFAKTSYNDESYDFAIRHATALWTCWLIGKHRDPQNETIEDLNLQVWDAEKESGILWDFVNGKSVFSFENSQRDFRGRLERLDSNFTSTGKVYLSGDGKAGEHKKYRIKIDTAGAVETATYKVSDDDGVTYGLTSFKTYFNQSLLIDDIWVRFDGIFELNDEWLIEILGGNDTVTSEIGSLKLSIK